MSKLNIVKNRLYYSFEAFVLVYIGGIFYQYTERYILTSAKSKLKELKKEYNEKENPDKTLEYRIKDLEKDIEELEKSGIGWKGTIVLLASPILILFGKGMIFEVQDNEQ